MGALTFEDVRLGFMRLCGEAEDGRQPVMVQNVPGGTGICSLKLAVCVAPKMAIEVPYGLCNFFRCKFGPGVALAAA
jgi:hypothetical protein